MRNGPNCYECKWRREVPGSAHSRCTHPSIGPINPMQELMSIFASVGRVPPVVGNTKELAIKGNPRGIAGGWFNWPVNFDPIWLEHCNGFEAKEKAVSA